jgi:hypothetical protein
VEFVEECLQASSGEQVRPGGCGDADHRVQLIPIWTQRDPVEPAQRVSDRGSGIVATLREARIERVTHPSAVMVDQALPLTRRLQHHLVNNVPRGRTVASPGSVSGARYLP